MIKSAKTTNIISPTAPAQITAEWLNDTFSPVSDGEIISVEIDKNFGPWSLLGKAIRVKLDWSAPKSEPKSVIVKFQVSTSVPKREGEVYELLSKAKVSYIPRIFSAFGKGNLVMEDLTATHSILKDDLSLAQIKNVISILADVQSRFFGDPRIPKYDLSHFVNSIHINMEGWDIFKDRYREQLGNETAAFEWISKNPEIVSSHYNSDPSSLSHGDVNGGNLLFPKAGNDRPVLIDWQLSAQRVLSFDLSYFMVRQLTVEQRREHEDELLRNYYELLSTEIKNRLSFDRLHLDYRACVTRSMLSAVMRVGPRFASHPYRLEAADRLATRVIAAVKDLEPLEAVQELKNK